MTNMQATESKSHSVSMTLMHLVNDKYAEAQAESCLLKESIKDKNADC